MHRVRQGCLTAAKQVDGFRGYKASPANPALQLSDLAHFSTMSVQT